MSDDIKQANLAIWNQVYETDIRFTKQKNLDGRIVTTIKPMYNVRRATELWGPVGTGWGWEILNEEMEVLAPIFLQRELEGGKKFEHYECGNYTVHTMYLQVWYLDSDGVRREVTQYGHTKVVYPVSGNTRLSVDGDYRKKSLTDAMGKCLSYLGFSGDIYMGMYEDGDYIQEAKEKGEVKKAEDKIERQALTQDEVVAKRADFADWLARAQQSYTMVSQAAPLKSLHNTNLIEGAKYGALLQFDDDRKEKTVASLKKHYDLQRDKIIPTQDTVCKECGVSAHQHLHRPCTECGGTVIAS